MQKKTFHFTGAYAEYMSKGLFSRMRVMHYEVCFLQL